MRKIALGAVTAATALALTGTAGATPAKRLSLPVAIFAIRDAGTIAGTPPYVGTCWRLTARRIDCHIVVLGNCSGLMEARLYTKEPNTWNVRVRNGYVDAEQRGEAFCG